MRGIHENIRKAVRTSLDEQRKALFGNAGKYSTLQEYAGIFDHDIISSIESGVPATVMAELRDVIMKRKREVERNTPKTEVSIELIANNHGESVELYVPTKVVGATSIENDLSRHVADSLPSAKRGEIFGYTSFLTQKEPELKPVEGALRLARIKPVITLCDLPLTGVYTGGEKAIINITPSAIQYQLIPVRKAHRTFFPGYQEDFTLDTPHGEIEVHVTSRTGTKVHGNYICSRNGELGDVFERMHLDVGDALEIEHLGENKYRMEKQ